MLIIRPLHPLRHLVCHIRQLVEADATHQPLPTFLVKRSPPVLHQGQTAGSISVRHGCNLVGIHLPEHREEQMEQVIAQHTVVLPPIGIQHIPQHHQNLIVRAGRYKPIADAFPLIAPGSRVLEHKQIRLQQPQT